MNSLTITITNPKGGTGKSTITCLLIEYLNFINKKVKLTDVDPNQTSKWWANECAKEGRTVLTEKDYEIEIIDTAGIIGSALPHLKRSNLIIVPFQAQVFDSKVMFEWIKRVQALNPEWSNKILIIVNRWQNTKEQREIVNNLKEYLKANKIGELIPYQLRNRPSSYADFLEGRDKNFFESKNSSESKELFSYIIKKLKEFK